MSYNVVLPFLSPCLLVISIAVAILSEYIAKSFFKFLLIKDTVSFGLLKDFTSIMAFLGIFKTFCIKGLRLFLLSFDNNSGSNPLNPPSISPYLECLSTMFNVTWLTDFIVSLIIASLCFFFMLFNFNLISIAKSFGYFFAVSMPSLSAIK